jgi:glycerate kinase
VTCLTDVTAPLLGPRGAAAVFGPQKGAGRAQITRLEAGLARLAELLGGDPAAPGAGAAGGTGYGLAAAWGAVLTPGAAELSRLAGLDHALANADLVITGEGRFDATSLTGKTCGTVIAAAAVAGVPVALVAGQVSGTPPEQRPARDGAPAPVAIIALNELAGGTAAALASPRRWLHQAGRHLAEERARD